MGPRAPEIRTAVKMTNSKASADMVGLALNRWTAARMASASFSGSSAGWRRGASPFRALGAICENRERRSSGRQPCSPA